jgi:hypothetical protein
MAERASNLRMRSILIDMARTWQRLALEVEQSRQNGVEQSRQKNKLLLPYGPRVVL